MLTKYYVALKFKNDSSLYRTIDSFKKRFDPKYSSHSFPNMSMLAPFLMDSRNQSTLIETLQEETQTFFYGHESALKLKFSGIEILKHHKKNCLFLNPINHEDMQYCLDLVQSICEGFIPKNIKYKQNKKQLLELAKFQSSENLYHALEDLKEQAITSASLKVDSIVLLKKSNSHWIVQGEIFKFEDNFDQLLQMQTLAL